MKISEIRKAIEDKKEEIRGFLDPESKDLENAKKAMDELRALNDTLKIEEELEETEKRDLEKQKTETRKVEVNVENKEFRDIVRSIMGEELSKEERANIKTVDNSAVVPKQFINELEEIRKGFGALKNYCDVKTVNKNEGTIPVVDYDQNTVADVAEGADIIDGTLVTTELPFKCQKIGLIQSLTSELVDDAEVEIENLVRNNFTEIAVAKENKKILAIVDPNATKVEAEDYTSIEDVMAKALPSVKSGLMTLTNVEGYAYLKNAKDTTGRNLGLITVGADGKEYFNGKEIVTFDSSLVALSEDKTMVFYVLNMKEAVKFADRKALTIARSTEAGWKDDTVKLRVLERFDVFKGSVRSVKKIEL